MSISGFITCLICASALTLVAATSKGQTALDKKVTISIKDQSLENAFEQLAKVASVTISYGDNRALEDHLSINASDEKLGTLLDRLLFNRPFSYISIDDKIIIRFTPDKPKTEKISPPSGTNGKVTDDKGQPLPGASIKVKDTGIATVTDKEGQFHLQQLQPEAVLVISYIGYQAQEIPVGNGVSLSIMLQLSTSKLDEVVIIPYGTTTQRLNTGSISRVTAELISQQPVANPLAALEGRIPGLIVTQNSGVAGSGFKVQIRGQNALSTTSRFTVNSDPFFIIDGVPFAPNNTNINTLFSSPLSGVLGQGLSPFSSINPSDIESIEVLKDADATAIYGSRGANGVVLITTKKGKAGNTRFNINVYEGVSRITQSEPYLNTQQYVQMRKEAYKNDGVTPTISNAQDLMVFDTTSNTDFRKLFLGGNAFTTDAQVSATGGSTNTNFLINGGFHREASVFSDKMADNRASLHASFNHASSDQKFKISFLLNYALDQNNMKGNSLLFSYISAYPPDYPPLTDANGDLLWTYKGIPFIDDNPLANLLTTYEAGTRNLTSNMQLSYNLLTNLTLKTSLGYNTLDVDEVKTSPLTSINPIYRSFGTSSNFGNRNMRSWIAEPQLEYKNEVGLIKLKALAGATWQQNNNNSLSLLAGGYTNDALIRYVAAGTTLTPTSNNYDYRYQAVFGRINLNWSDKYLVNLTGRRDGSSRFGPGKQFSNFRAIGAAWLFNNEPLIKKALPFLSFGKLRGSYGITGSDQIDNYQFLDTWSVSTLSYQSTLSLYPTRLANPDYRWETNEKLEGSIDLGFIKDRVFFSATYFRTQSDNHLISYALPSQTGFTTIVRNFPALIRNTGWELVLTTKNLAQTNFSWESNLNLTIPKNVLVSFPGIETTSYSAYRVGESLSSINTIQSTGVDPQTGVFTFLDLNSDGVVNSKDNVNVGNLDPKFYGGLNNDLKYKNWSLSFFIEFKKQMGINYLSTIYQSVAGNQYNNLPVEIFLNRWQKPGDQSKYQRLTTTSSTAAYTAASRYIVSSAVYSDASYIRLKTVSLGYNLTKSLLRNLHLENCRFYIQGQNLFTVSNYLGNDPETQSQNGLPPLKTLTAGIQLTL